MEYLNTRKIGDIGEAYAIAAFTQAGCSVSIPFTENIPYDLIIDYKNTLYKIQVKTTQYIKNETMIFSTDRTNPFNGNHEKYNTDEIDYFFLYCVENGWSGLIKCDDFCGSEIWIRVALPKNNNFYKTKMADDYEFFHRIDELKYGIEIPLIIYEKPEKPKITHKIVNEIPNRTTRQKLKNEIRHMPFVKVAELYGVSDNAIRKWCVRMGLPDKSTHIKRLTDEQWDLI